MADLQGKLAVVTGANSGIGLEACVQLAKRGCEIVMCCRTVSKAESAKADVAKRSGLSEDKITIVQLDLADLDNIESFRSRYDVVPALAGRPVDMLILNAGIMAPNQREVTKQGLEAQFGTNVVGHYKFAACMFDLCKTATHSRIVFVSSLMHKYTRGINVKDFTREKYSKWPIYCESKLSDLVLAFKLNRLLVEKGVGNVIAVGCHPGYSATNLQTHTATYFMNFIVAQSASAGAEPTVLAATDPEAKRDGYCGPSGWFEIRGKPTWNTYVNPAAFDQKLQDELWDKCEELTKCNFATKI
jgi:NAD(P)-dependent dehydrogenase (short-subunit alcohol dehydrogenase family)